MQKPSNFPRIDVSGMNQDDLMLEIGVAIEQINGLVTVATQDYEMSVIPSDYELQRMYPKTQALLFAITKYAYEANLYIDALAML